MSILIDVCGIQAGVILQQVNCCGVMGAGIAKVIAEKWPKVKQDYLEFCSGERPADLLGEYQVVPIDANLYVVNLFGQQSYGREVGRCYTNYESLENSLRGFRKWYEANIGHNLPIFYPKLGCGLGGAKWEKVSRIIDTELQGLEHHLMETD